MKENNTLMKFAMAGLVGAAMVSAAGTVQAKGKSQKADVTKCYGVNKCKGFGKCGGSGHDCAGKNSCKGQGWLLMPKDSCNALDGGSLTPPADASSTAAPAPAAMPSK